MIGPDVAPPGLPSPRRAPACAFALVALLGVAGGALATLCEVPSASYPTLPAALADPTCDPILVAAGTYATNLEIGRDVTIAGAGSASTTIAGWVRVAGAATDAVLDAIRIDATAASVALCSASGLDAHGGARVSGLDLVVVGRPTPNAACGFFTDGFESGDLAAWSAKRP